MIMPLSGSTEDLEATIEELRIPTSVYATDIHAGISLAQKEFEQNSLKSVPKFFVLVSDGDPHAHSRGFGYQHDILNIEYMKKGNPDKDVDPVHVFTLYSGETIPYQDEYSEEVRMAAIKHMQRLASDRESFYFYEEYPELVNLFEQISNCL